MGKEVTILTVTTPETIEKELNERIYNHIRVLTIPTSKIRLYMPLSYGLRPKYLLNVLMTVKGLNKPTLAHLRKLGFHSECSQRAVMYLKDRGFIQVVSRKRLIIPFGKYKIDAGYVITETGDSVLKKILTSR